LPFACGEPSSNTGASINSRSEFTDGDANGSSHIQSHIFRPSHFKILNRFYYSRQPVVLNIYPSFKPIFANINAGFKSTFLFRLNITDVNSTCPALSRDFAPRICGALNGLKSISFLPTIFYLSNNVAKSFNAQIDTATSFA
jgi:hypothetical protein